MNGASTLADDDLTAARAGDHAAFDRLVGPEVFRAHGLPLALDR